MTNVLFEGQYFGGFDDLTELKYIYLFIFTLNYSGNIWPKVCTRCVNHCLHWTPWLKSWRCWNVNKISVCKTSHCYASADHVKSTNNMNDCIHHDGHVDPPVAMVTGVTFQKHTVSSHIPLVWIQSWCHGNSQFSAWLSMWMAKAACLTYSVFVLCWCKRRQCLPRPFWLGSFFKTVNYTIKKGLICCTSADDTQDLALVSPAPKNSQSFWQTGPDQTVISGY